MTNDLISRRALIAYVKELPTYDPTNKGFIFKRYPSGLFAPDDIVKSIQNAPAVDAVPVVRCKDCAFYDFGECCNTTMDMSDGAHFYPYPTDFCSYGERRADDGK